jgi:hypothetical protein
MRVPVILTEAAAAKLSAVETDALAKDKACDC